MLLQKQSPKTQGGKLLKNIQLPNFSEKSELPLSVFQLLTMVPETAQELSGIIVINLANTSYYIVKVYNFI